MLTSTVRFLGRPVLRRGRVALLASCAVLTGALLAAPVSPALSAPVLERAGQRVTQWAPVARATITPGVQMSTSGAQCTANFVFTDARGGVYVGYAAHCAGLGSATDTNGCRSRSLPLGTRVTFVRGASPASDGTRIGGGTLAYSSWRSMRRAGTRAGNACAYNDLALVRVNPRDVRKVNPSVPVWGGPTGIDTNGTRAGDRLYSYGNSSLRGGVAALSPKVGVSLGDDASDGGWSHPLYSVSPGLPGDSGSAFLSEDGKAVGTLSTLGLLPLPLSNNLGDLARELRFAQGHSGISGLRLTQGTQPFSG